MPFRSTPAVQCHAASNLHADTSNIDAKEQPAARPMIADGVGADAIFQGPTGIAAFPPGGRGIVAPNVVAVVADTLNKSIRTVTLAGEVRTLVCGGGSAHTSAAEAAARLANPTAILAGTGMYKDGSFEQATFAKPVAVAVDISGKVVVLDVYDADNGAAPAAAHIAVRIVDPVAVTVTTLELKLFCNGKKTTVIRPYPSGRPAPFGLHEVSPGAPDWHTEVGLTIDEGGVIWTASRPSGIHRISHTSISPGFTAYKQPWAPTYFCHRRLCSRAGRAAVRTILRIALRLNRTARASPTVAPDAGSLPAMVELPQIPQEIWLQILRSTEPWQLGERLPPKQNFGLGLASDAGDSASDLDEDATAAREAEAARRVFQRFSDDNSGNVTADGSLISRLQMRDRVSGTMTWVAWLNCSVCKRRGNFGPWETEGEKYRADRGGPLPCCPQCTAAK